MITETHKAALAELANQCIGVRDLSRNHSDIKHCPTARIKFHGLHVASIDGAAFEKIADEPVFDDHQRRPGSKALTFRALLEPSGPPRHERQRVPFAAGLVDRVARALTAQGIVVPVNPTRHFSGTDQVSKPVPERVQRACSRPRSLFIVPNLKERIRFIVELSTAVPQSHMLVVARNNQQAKEVASMLADATGREATWGFNERHAFPWLHVKSVGALAGDSAFQWGFVVFLDAETAIATTSMEFLAPGEGTVRIGFLSRNVHQHHERERGALEALFGPVDADLKFADVSVAWLRPKVRSPMRFANVVERNRTLVWRNDPLNHLIARAARALTSNNSVAVEMLGLHGATRGLLAGNPAEPPTVTIVVANTEQGQELARLLPGWRFEAAGHTYPPGKLITDERVIMTLARAAEELLATSLIIYAAGGSDWWIEHLSGLFWGLDMLIIDIADQHDERSAGETASRAAGYRHLGYREVPPDDPTRTWPGKPDQKTPEKKPRARRDRSARKGGGYDLRSWYEDQNIDRRYIRANSHYRSGADTGEQRSKGKAQDDDGTGPHGLRIYRADR